MQIIINVLKETCLRTQKKYYGVSVYNYIELLKSDWRWWDVENSDSLDT